MNDELYGDQALPANIRDEVLKEAKQNGFDGGVRQYRSYGPVLAKAMTDVLKRMGHDGVIAEDVDGLEAVVFDSRQAKSIYNQNPTSDPRLMFEPEWVYRSDQIIDEKIKGPMPGKQILATLKSAGVKTDELEWTGLDTFLDTNEKKTPSQVKEYLNANKLQIHEVEKGEAKAYSENDVVYDGTDEPDLGRMDGFKGLHYFNVPGNRLQIPVSKYPTPEDAKRYILESKKATQDYTKFSTYKLPGGENYREVLFTLPKTDIENAPRKIKAGSEEAYANILKNEIEPLNYRIQNLHLTRDGDYETIAGQRDALEEQLYELTEPDLSETPFANRSNGGYYQSGHWSEQNVLAHTRLDDRTDSNGRKLLFVEEIQSDWHQEGREAGYQVEYPDTIAELTDGQLKNFIKANDRNSDTDGMSRQEMMDMATNPADGSWDGMGLTDKDLIDFRKKGLLSVIPSAPFKKTWHEFVFKRIFKEAVAKGYDAIAWTTGEQQNDRYRLSKRIGRIEYDSSDNTLTAWNPDMSETVMQERYSKDELPGVIGKDVSEKLLATTPDEGGTYSLAGLNLDVGGAGMKGFYDKMIVDYANKLGKRFGVKVEDALIGDGKDSYLIVEAGTGLADGQFMAGPFATELEAEQYASALKLTYYEITSRKATVHSLAVNDEMKEQAEQEGVLLFQGENKTPFTAEETIEITSYLDGLIEQYKKRSANPDSLIPSLKPAMAEEYQRRHEGLSRIKEGLLDGIRKYKNPSRNEIALIHPGTREAKYQVSFFDDRGPYSDRQANTPLEIVVALTDEPFYQSMFSEPVEGHVQVGDILFQPAPTDSEAFKEWFGDSKVVDEDGNPLRVYHGSDRSFEQFRISAGMYGMGYYFTDSTVGTDTSANHYATNKGRKDSYGAQIYPVYLSIQNPFYADYATKKNMATIGDEYDGMIVENLDGTKYYIAREDTQIKSVNNPGGWSSTDSRIMFQPGENGTLAVLHNTNAERIMDIDSFGGLPMPSIAVTRPDIPFDGFGDSTLIAKAQVARDALDEGRLFDRDIWSPTVPSPKWKVDWKRLGEYEKLVDEGSRKIGRRFYIEQVGKEQFERGPEEAKRQFKYEDGSKVAYLDKNGIAYEIVMKPVDGPSGVPIGVVAAVKEYLDKNNITGWIGHDDKDGHFEALGGVIRTAALNEKEMKRIAKKDPELANDIIERWTTFSYKSRIFDAARVYVPGSTEVSYRETMEKIDEAIKPHEEAYASWVSSNVQPAYSDPKIKVGGKMVPFNASSILEWMNRQNVQASQETMTYGPAKAAASAGRNFMSREQIAAMEGSLVTQEEHQKYWKENIEPMTKEIQEKLPEYYKYDDTWEALDTIYKSIGAYLKTSTGKSPERMKKTLSAHGFTNVPKELVGTALDVAMFIATAPQDYYEAKPSKIIQLSDFKAAVIPASTNEDVKSAIRETGLEVHEYEGSQHRNELVKKLTESDPELLFQPDMNKASRIAIEDTSTKVQDELHIRGIPYFVQFSRSSLSRYYRFAYDDREYQVRISDHKAPYSRYYGKTDFDIDVRRPLEIDRFRKWLEEEAGVLYPGKGMYEPATMFSADDDPAPPDMEEFGKNRGKFTEMMNADGKVEEFLKALWGRMKEDYDASDEARPKSETEYRLSSHPFVAGAAVSVGRNGKALDPRVRRAVLGVIRKNEVAFKEMYADIMGDLGMAQEVRQERASVVGFEPVKTPKLKGYQPMTLAERQAIVDRVRDKLVKEKIENDSITDVEIVEYIGRLELDRAKLSAKERSLEKEREGKAAYVDALKSARQEASLQTREAVAEVRAMHKLREVRQRIMKEILTPPGKSVNYEQKTKIRFIQAYLRTKRWEVERTEAGGYKRTGNITQPRYDELLKTGLFRETPGLENTLASFIVERINSKPVSDWSMAELEEMSMEIDALRKEGLLVTEMKSAKRRKLYETTRLAIERVMKTSPEYRKPYASQSEEEREQLKKLNNTHTLTFAGINMRRFAANYLDKGNAEKTNYNLLVDEELDHFRGKMKNYDRRTKAVKAFMDSKGLKPKDLYRKITIEVNGRPATYTATDLMMILLAVRNDYSKAAFVFGNLFDNDERKAFDGMDKDEVLAKGEQRLRPIMEAVEKQLTQAEKQTAELISADFDKEYDRLNDVVIELTNEDMKRESNYVPIRRTGVEFTTVTEETMNDLYARMGMMMNATPENGFTKSRIKMGPAHQTAIKLDLFATWLDAVEKQEHLINYGEYNRKLIGVYGDRVMGAGTIREAILHRWGPGAVKYLEQYIAEVANPIQYKDRAYSEALVRKFRGNLAVGYLAYRWSSVLNQIISSPLPFLAYAPGHMVGAAAEMIQNPMKFIEEVEELSVVLKHRQFDVMYELVKHRNPDGWDKMLKDFGAKGMEGLRWADRWTVAVGWKAVYNSEYEKTHNVEQAVKKADDVVLKCQPSARGVDQAPLFRDNNEWSRAFTMFGSQLNVVWQQASQDVPSAISEKNYGEAVGIIVGMILTGIGLGAVKKLRKKDDDDGWKDWVYYSISQPLESAPLIGSLLSGAARSVITGDHVWSSGDGMMPVAEEMIGGATRLLKGDVRGIGNVAEGIGLTLGLPTLAAKENLDIAIDLIGGIE